MAIRLRCLLLLRLWLDIVFRVGYHCVRAVVPHVSG